MILVEYKDEFKTGFGWSYGISVGKTDKNKEKMITFYNSKRTRLNTGFKNGVQSNIKPITILLRYGKNQRLAEEKAKEIQDFYNRRSFLIGDTQVFSNLIYAEPISLGTDENNIYEYSFEIDFIENDRKD